MESLQMYDTALEWTIKVRWEISRPSMSERLDYLEIMRGCKTRTLLGVPFLDPCCAGWVVWLKGLCQAS